MTAHRLARASKAYQTTQAATLAFTQEELDVLEMLTWHIGGSPDGPRGVMDRIAERIRERATPRERRNGKLVEAQGSIFLRYEP